jgi:hypothetical protein
MNRLTDQMYAFKKKNIYGIPVKIIKKMLKFL